MKRITTKHGVIGYTENVTIVEQALREQFGIDDQSGVLTALAQHVWSQLAYMHGAERQWGTEQIQIALAAMQARMSRIVVNVAEFSHAHNGGAL